MTISIIPFIDAINTCHGTIGDGFFRKMPEFKNNYDPLKVLEEYITPLVEAAEKGDLDAESAVIKLVADYFDSDKTSPLGVRMHAMVDNQATHSRGFGTSC